MAGTTAKGVAYPTNTDNKDFAADMQTLAQSANDNFVDLDGDILRGPLTADSGMAKGYRLRNEGGSVDSRTWATYVSGSTMRVAAVNDAASAGTDFLSLDRVANRITLSQPAVLKNHAFRMESSGGGSMATGTGWTKFNFWDSTIVDASSAVNLSTDEYTAPTTGLYFFSLFLSYNDAAKLSIAFKAYIGVNGVAKYEHISAGNTDATTAISRKTIDCSTILSLQANDVISVYYSLAAASVTPLELAGTRRPALSGFMVTAL